MSRPIISAEGLSKAYLIGVQRERLATLTAAAWKMLKAPVENYRRLQRLNTYAVEDDAEDVYWALKDVSFEINEGEVVGVIGRNGAGKSTLLKLLSRITDPTRGRAVLRGRVSSLLEVGTGFHPELSGRENVYLNGTILGMTRREVDRKFDEIVEFSGVEKFLDTPLKRYSSGMAVRLAFAVAAHLEPEILIIDEVLAVGDAEFQNKCLGRMKDVAQGGRTVLFVSHHMPALTTLCPRCILLAGGSVKADGDTQSIIPLYLSSGSSPRCETGFDRPLGDPTAWVRSLRFLNHEGTPSADFDVRHPITVEIEVVVEKRQSGTEISVRVQNAAGVAVFSTERSQSIESPMEPGTHTLSFVIPPSFLTPHKYTLTLGCHRSGVEIYHLLEDAGTFTLHETGSTMHRYAGAITGVVQFHEPWNEH